METVNVDSVGPLPADHLGNQYVLVVIDCFTRWVQLYPLQSVSALPTAVALLNWVSNYSAPSFLRSDGGSQFVNEVIYELTQLMGTEQSVTLAYSHEENGLVERANRTMITHLRAVLFDKHVVGRWSESLPLVQRIMNATPHTSTGVAPFKLLYGNAIDLDRNILFHVPPTEHFDPTITRLSDHVVDLIKVQDVLMRKAQQAQRKLDERRVQERTAKQLQQKGAHKSSHANELGDQVLTEYDVNSYVLMNYPDTIAGKKPPHKLLTYLKGPLRVVSYKGARYQLEDLTSRKIVETHVSNLRPFYYDPEEVDPLQIALKDKEQYVVQKIVAHRGVWSQKTQMSFKVRWAGYDESQDTWEPWTALLHNQRLHEYLRDKGQARLIPKSHR
jgi:hypothetical protein